MHVHSCQEPPVLQDTGIAVVELVVVASVPTIIMLIAILMPCSRHHLEISGVLNITEQQLFHKHLEEEIGLHQAVENASRLPVLLILDHTVELQPLLS